LSLAVKLAREEKQVLSICYHT